MGATLEEILASVWRQVLVEEVNTVKVDTRRFLVRRTSQSRLREADFQFEEHELRGLEQSPHTSSRWAQLAREGKKVMQFLSSGCGRRGWKSAVLWIQHPSLTNNFPKG